MRYTKNLHLAKPSPDDFYDIAEFGNNMDILDEFYGTTFQEGNINLLVNADFINPVNSSGKNEWDATSMTSSFINVMNWRMQFGLKATLTDSGLVIINDTGQNKYFLEIVPLSINDVDGKDVTMSVLDSEGKLYTASMNISNLTLDNDVKEDVFVDDIVLRWQSYKGDIQFTVIMKSTKTISRCKLEFGTESTLMYDLPQDPKLELAKIVAPYVVNENLLDNWYFVNPTNQRGQTEYDATANKVYTIDRWAMRVVANDGNKTVLTEEGLKIPANNAVYSLAQWMNEQLDFLKGKTLTLSALFSDGELTTKTFTLPTSISANTNYGHAYHSTGKVYAYVRWYTNGNFIFDVYATADRTQDYTVKAAKLELGTIQTLAHLENGKWVLNEVPNKAEELAKCRYFYLQEDDYMIVPCYFTTTDALNVLVPISTEMRLKTPTVINVKVNWIKTEGSTVTVSKEYTNATAIARNGYIELVIPYTHGKTLGTTGVCNIASLKISSEL